MYLRLNHLSIPFYTESDAPSWMFRIYNSLGILVASPRAYALLTLAEWAIVEAFRIQS